MRASGVELGHFIIMQEIEREDVFVEIVAPLSTDEEKALYVKAFVSRVDEPKQCSELIKALDSFLPLRVRNKNKGKNNLGDHVYCRTEYPLGHLRRIRRVEKTVYEVENSKNIEEKKSPSKKRQRKTNEEVKISMEVLVYSPSIIHYHDDEQTKQALSDTISRFRLKLEERLLPGRPAKSKEELAEFNKLWPTLYFHEQSDEYKETELTLTSEETRQMSDGITCAVEDASSCKSQYRAWLLSKTLSCRRSSDLKIGGVVVIDPTTGEVVSQSSEERRLLLQSKDQSSAFPDEENPLCTPILLALQGISRKEREAAIGLGMNSPEFAGGQYLCTGFDVYTIYEPDVFEAMSLVHSRVRRVIFAIQDSINGGLGGSDNETNVHALPGTNHHYRAFRVVDRSVLDKCKMAVEINLCGNSH